MLARGLISVRILDLTHTPPAPSQGSWGKDLLGKRSATHARQCPSMSLKTQAWRPGAWWESQVRVDPDPSTPLLLAIGRLRDGGRSPLGVDWQHEVFCS